MSEGTPSTEKQGAADTLIPVTILTGFLGSGKTTLLARLLKHPDMKNVAVLINEFGEVGLDDAFVEKLDGDVVMMQSGCLCCTIRNDLSESMNDLWLKRVKGTVPEFDRIVIETTGLADPAPIVHTLMTDPMVAAHYRLDGVVTTVDALNAENELDRQFESVKQAAVADRLVLTKTDLADAPTVERVTARIRKLNPAAPLHSAVLGDITPDKLIHAGLFNPKTKIADVEGWLKAEAYDDGHDHHHDHDHGHDHDRHDDHGSGKKHQHAHDRNRHDDEIEAYAVFRDQPFTRESLAAWLDALLTYLGPDLLRVKGLLNVDDMPVALHGVQHLFYPPTMLKEWPSADRRSRVVFITRKIPRAFIEQTLSLIDARYGKGLDTLTGRMRE